MIKVYIPRDKNFNYKQCKKLFKKNRKLLCDNRDFREIVNTTFFYSFFDDEKHLGCIYYYYENDKLFVNVVAYRHTHLINIECFKLSLTWFNCDIYANCLHRTSAIGALKCGFKRIKDNLFKYERS